MQSTIESCSLLLKHIVPSCLPTMLSEVLGESLPYLGKLTKTSIACHSHTGGIPRAYQKVWRNRHWSCASWTVFCRYHRIIQLANLNEEAVNCSIPSNSPLSRPCNASLMRASRRILWSLTPRLYLRPSRTPATEPSATAPDSTQRSLKPASWKRLPIMDSRVQAVWNTPILNTISLNLSLCFHWTSVALIQCFVKDENDAL